MTICTNLSDEQVKLAFEKFDTSGDDKLDYREFCQMIRQKVEVFLENSSTMNYEYLVIYSYNRSPEQWVPKNC